MKSRRRKAIWIFTLSPDSFSSCQVEIVLVCLPDRHVLGCLNIFFYHVIWVGFFVFWGGGFTARRFHLLLYEASFLFSSCICFCLILNLCWLKTPNWTNAALEVQACRHESQLKTCVLIFGAQVSQQATMTVKKDWSKSSFRLELDTEAKC